MARLHYNLLQAVLDADIDDNDLTITFTAPLKEWGEDNIATITAPDTLAIRIGYELLHITAYTSGASSATVIRGQEGSTATAHVEEDAIRHVITDLDLGGAISDTAYDATTWNGDTTVAPSKNAVRDKIEDILDGVTFTGDVIVPDEAYDATAWNGSLEVPTKNAIRDKIETLSGGALRVEDEGGTIVAAATGVNFAGAGVTVTDAGSNEALVTIPGGGGSAATTTFDDTGLSFVTGADVQAALEAVDTELGTLTGTFVRRVRQTLTSKTSFSGTGQEQVGTEEATYDDALLPVLTGVTVFASAPLLAANSSSTTSINLRVEISLDGGSTWDNGSNLSTREAGGSNASNSFSMTPMHQVTGTVTGDIQARVTAQCGTGAGTAWDIFGEIYMEVVVPLA